MSRIHTFFPLFAVLLLIGCSGSGIPPVGEVHGQITLNGEPVPNCHVMFEPIAGGRSSSAMTDDSGRYVLKYKGDADGALLGKHRVRLITSRDPSRDDNGRITDPGVKEKLPKEYNSETTQQVEVVDGDNPIDFVIQTS
ncbi:carboxypeptidase-like regulatory domain-containing protein [Bremerella sp. T1]|uniref:carboxypeptidase-like regulatory domain-containing protein n=1 Tax=Bremerella sp. TYQ1 TaxID=3119568 RepID=UPI001CD0018F|nr:carboxypeptidase-like regulatory domain-containing protein [Bremerella volcania]UBM38150.1 carboxypeptidase-like regulatory domain-containing protein [Bremerella volcania]